MPTKDPEKRRAAYQRWRERNREKAVAATKAWRERNPDYHRNWHAANPEKRAAATQKWRAENREQYLAGAREAYRRRKDAACAQGRRYRLKKNYGLTPDEVEVLFVSQGSVCALCSTDEPGRHPGWVVDHCHVTGKVRGVLCPDCNLSLRKGRDTVEHLERALAYVRRALA